METEWIPQLQRLLDIETGSLPIIWDVDFLYGAKTAAGEETYVLCEINVSSVYPYPDMSYAVAPNNWSLTGSNHLNSNFDGQYLSMSLAKRSAVVSRSMAIKPFSLNRAA